MLMPHLPHGKTGHTHNPLKKKTFFWFQGIRSIWCPGTATKHNS